MDMEVIEMALPDKSIELTLEQSPIEYVNEASQSLAMAKDFFIDCPEMFEAADSELSRIKTRYKEIDEIRKNFTRPLDTLKKQWMEVFRQPLERLEQAEGILKGLMKGYLVGQEKIRKAKELEARKQAEEEQRKLREQAEAEAKAGNVETAQEIEQQAVHVRVPVVTAPKLNAKATARKTWQFKITDKMALIKAVAEGRVPPAALEVNEKIVRQQVNSLKQELNWDGVEVFEDTTIAAGRR